MNFIKLKSNTFILSTFLVLSLGKFNFLHAQDGDVATMLQAIKATTPLPAAVATNGSNFYSAQHSPGSEQEWPPLPCEGFGHSWWNLSSDAPIEALHELIPLVNSIGVPYYNYVGLAGYFPVNQNPFLLLGDCAGKIVQPGNGSESIHHGRSIGFEEFKKCLLFTGDLAAHPGTYDLFRNNCTTVTVRAGDRAGVSLPADWNPQNFGIDLKAMLPEDE